MSQPKTNDVLERLLALLVRSFPAYLHYARPFATAQDQHVLETFSQIQADQAQLAERVGQAIRAAGFGPRLGDFPMEYTDLHDLSADFLLRMAIAYQQQDVEELKQCVDALRLAPMAQAFAEEGLGLAKGHLETLQELSRQPV